MNQCTMLGVPDVHETTCRAILRLVNSIGPIFLFINVPNANGTPELYELLTSFVTEGTDLSFTV